MGDRSITIAEGVEGAVNVVHADFEARSGEMRCL